MKLPTKLLLAKMLSFTLTAMGATVAHAADEVPTQPGAELRQEPARQGWFWYLDPKKEKKAPLKVAPTPDVKPETSVPTANTPPLVVIGKSGKPSEEECRDKKTWAAACGFVDPGADFEFQAKQRDILLQQFSIQPDVPEVVEAAQRYMKWVVGKASMAANMWYFNQVQKPDLDPTVKNPISEVGLALASKIEKANRQEYFQLMREEGGMLFYFTKSDCVYCHQQAPYTQRVARMMGLKLVNIPVDGKCIETFEGDACVPTIKPEQLAVLDLKTVPTLFLYVPSNTWIRLATGLTTDVTVMANAVNFFSAYRAAMLNGLDNGKGSRPSVTFDPKFNVKNTGTAEVSNEKPVALPDSKKMMELLGYGGAK